MAHTVEEEEFGDDEGLDEHGEAGADTGQEREYVHDADGVEDDVAWASQRFLTFPERHSEGGLWWYLITILMDMNLIVIRRR